MESHQNPWNRMFFVTFKQSNLSTSKVEREGKYKINMVCGDFLRNHGLCSYNIAAFNNQYRYFVNKTIIFQMPGF